MLTMAICFMVYTFTVELVGLTEIVELDSFDWFEEVINLAD